jgi:hypothetical protein
MKESSLEMAIERSAGQLPLHVKLRTGKVHGLRKETACRQSIMRDLSIDEGRSQCIRTLLLKFTLVYVQRHCFQFKRLPCVKAYADSVWLGGDGVVLSPVGHHILQEFNALYVTRFRTFKIAYPFQDKNLEG